MIGSNALDRYIWRNIIFGFFTSLFILVSLVVFFYLKKELSLSNKVNGYGFNDVLIITLLTVPRQIGDMAIWAMLLGTVFGLASHAKHNEFLPILTSGFSKKRLIANIVVVSSVIGIVVFLISGFIAPKTDKIHHFKKLSILGKDMYASEKGLWFSYNCKNSVCSFANAKRITKQGIDNVTSFTIDNTKHPMIASINFYPSISFSHKHNRKSTDGFRLKLMPDKFLIEDINNDDLIQQSPNLRLLKYASFDSVNRLSVIDLVQSIWFKFNANQFFADNLYSLIMKLLIPINFIILSLLGLSFTGKFARNTSFATTVFYGFSICVGLFLTNTFLASLVKLGNFYAVIFALTPTIIVTFISNKMLRQW